MPIVWAGDRNTLGSSDLAEKNIINTTKELRNKLDLPIVAAVKNVRNNFHHSSTKYGIMMSNGNKHTMGMLGSVAMEGQEDDNELSIQDSIMCGQRSIMFLPKIMSSVRQKCKSLYIQSLASIDYDNVY